VPVKTVTNKVIATPVLERVEIPCDGMMSNGFWSVQVPIQLGWSPVLEQMIKAVRQNVGCQH